MTPAPIATSAISSLPLVQQPRAPAVNAAAAAPEVRKAFQQFVGETFYGQMLSAMRKTVGKPAYFHGGRAEEVFQGQLDQMLGERLAEATAADFADPMFQLFALQRQLS